jgi:hypothetical protein
MRMMFRSAVAGAIVLGAVLSLSVSADDAKPKYTIKEVMKIAHKDGLMKKLASGQGTPQDAEQLLDLYKALGENKPPKGDPESWKAKTTTLVQAAQDVVDKKDGAPAALQKAANCAECHKAHK